MNDVLSLTYSDIKTVKTRGVYQLVLEAPIEGMADAIKLFGAPVPGDEVWAAVARLRPGTEKVEQIADHRPAKLAQLAGIICNEQAFWRFLTENGHDTSSADQAAEHVRLICGAIPSRRDLDSNSEAGRKFRELRTDYDNWRKGLVA